MSEEAMVLSSSEMVMEVGKAEKRQRIDRKRNEEEKEDGRGGSQEKGSVPRMVLRVLLVEDDDSTRQIVAALLRKCGYIVFAVSDGLKAWETLKEKAWNIDLILTEMELPLISGFALLSLVMEHEVCKNIPVIMMSSQDSISMVFKCMLKGAADYLIKPLRTNELRNLWQHSWRRHTLLQKQSCSTTPSEKVEPAYKKNAANNRSCDYKASSQNTKECSEKGSVTQSSCTTPYLEAESEQVQNMQDISPMKCESASNLSKNNVEMPEDCAKLNEEFVIDASETGGNSNLFKPEVVFCNRAFKSTVLSLKEDHDRIKRLKRDASVQLEIFESNNADVTTESQSCCDELVNPSSGAIDLIGMFGVHPRCTSGPSIVDVDGANNSVHAPHLELSLRRICPEGSKGQRTGERPKLNHSNASAFSWYNNSTTLQSLFATLPSGRTESKDGPKKSEELLFNQSSDNFTVNSQQYDSTTSNSHDNALAVQSGHTEVSYLSPQLGLIPVTGANLENICSGYGQFFPSLFYMQSSLSPTSPVSKNQREKSPFAVNNASDHSDIHHSEETSNKSICETKQAQNNLELEEDMKPTCLVADQSNGVADHVNSCAQGRSDESTISAEADEKAISGLNYNCHLVQERFRGMDSVRISQREEALAKFRMKRKDRCFEKKVRYQSRKRLAEQRPRVKGQFVRQSAN